MYIIKFMKPIYQLPAWPYAATTFSSQLQDVFNVFALFCFVSHWLYILVQYISIGMDMWPFTGTWTAYQIRGHNLEKKKKKADSPFPSRYQLPIVPQLTPGLCGTFNESIYICSILQRIGIPKKKIIGLLRIYLHLLGPGGGGKG